MSLQEVGVEYGETVLVGGIYGSGGGAGTVIPFTDWRNAFNRSAGRPLDKTIDYDSQLALEFTLPRLWRSDEPRTSSTYEVQQLTACVQYMPSVESCLPPDELGWRDGSLFVQRIDSVRLPERLIRELLELGIK